MVQEFRSTMFQSALASRRRPALLVAGALLVSAAAASPAAAAGKPFTCEASAVKGKVLTGPVVEPFVANRGKPCATTTAGGNAAALAPAKVRIFGAGTTLTGPAGRTDLQKAAASGGIADLSLGSLASLGLSLPLGQIPLPDLKQTIDISAVTGPINAAIAGGLPITLPPLPLRGRLAGLPPLPIPVPVPLPVPLPPVTIPPLPAGTQLPTSLTIDLTAAIRALLALPTTDLLDVKSAVAFAQASCANGAPVMAGQRSVAGVTVLGNAINLDTLGDQPILDTQQIDLSKLDLSQVQIPAIDALTGGALAAVTAQVSAVVSTALKALPPIGVPIELARVQVTPGTQTKTADSLTQTALGIKVQVAGQNVVDLSFGEAKVGTAGVDCAVAKPPTSTTAAESALQCTTRKLVLLDVLRKGSRVAINGVADKKLVGRSVGIRFQGDHHIAGHATVAKNGTFKTTVALPRKALRSSDRARYQAVLGKEKSLNLKLQRRMVVTKLTSSNSKVTIAGRVTRPLGAPSQTITLTRRITCKKSAVVKRFKPKANGTFSVTIAAPTGVTSAVYRLSTKVRKTTRNPKLFSTFTLPKGVDLEQ